MANIAVIGDVHGEFNEADVAYFNDSDYDLLLFVGDLRHLLNVRPVWGVCAQVAQLTKPALLVPGNHDVHNVFQLLAEALDAHWLARLSGFADTDHHQRLQERLEPVTLTGYDTHHFEFDGVAFDVVAGRPYSMGGPGVDYEPLLQKVYGVASIEESAARLRQCVDATASDRLVFLAHNGPTGMGAAPSDMWGRDFGPEHGDWGDEDLRAAVDYALAQGKRVDAVVAGHMHLQTKQGIDRPWCIKVDDTLYINAAREPRIRRQDGKEIHHHICLRLLDGDADAVEYWV
jgi:uncharacterized protein (TIGR04168 family)